MDARGFNERGLERCFRVMNDSFRELMPEEPLDIDEALAEVHPPDENGDDAWYCPSCEAGPFFDERSQCPECEWSMELMEEKG